MEVMRVVSKRPIRKEPEVVCVREVHATLLSLGGVLLVSVCVMLSLFAFVVSQMADVTSVQRGIAIVLVVAVWLYAVSSATEKIQLVDHAVEYVSVLSRRVSVSLDDLQEMLFIHQGFNLEQGIETIEFRRRDGSSDRIALGPCWQRHDLEMFLHSVEEALNAPKLLEEVR